MKFIKTDRGYLNAAHARYLFVGENPADKSGHLIKLETDDDLYYLAATFDTKEEAEEYLDELIEELEG